MFSGQSQEALGAEQEFKGRYQDARRAQILLHEPATVFELKVGALFGMNDGVEQVGEDKVTGAVEHHHDGVGRETLVLKMVEDDGKVFDEHPHQVVAAIAGCHGACLVEGQVEHDVARGLEGCREVHGHLQQVGLFVGTVVEGSGIIAQEDVGTHKGNHDADFRQQGVGIFIDGEGIPVRARADVHEAGLLLFEQSEQVGQVLRLQQVVVAQKPYILAV